MEHTPGPWTADIRKWSLDGRKMRGTWVITKDDYQPVARINGIGPSSQANARLIAAAPALLEALEHVHATLNNIIGDRNLLETYLPLLLQDARAAIEAAKRSA